MNIKLINKKCPNCGANLKFGFEDTSVTCEYCDTHVLIEYQRENMYKPPENSKEVRIYVNKTTEIFKWISRILGGTMIAFMGMAIMSFSSVLPSIIMIVAGILAMLTPSLKIFGGNLYIKIGIVTILAVGGFFWGIADSYDLPKEFQGKYVSETTNLTVQIKGNKIIVNDNGHIVKEKLYTWKETYGHIVYHNIKVNNGEYNFRICINPGKGYQFYQCERLWSKGTHYFYNTKNKKDEYVLGEFSSSY